MQTALLWVGYFFAILATLPFLTFLFIYVIAFRLTRDKKRTIRKAMDLTTVLLMLAVGTLWQYVWNVSTGWWVVLGFLALSYLVLALLHMIVRGTITWRKFVRNGWRIAFFMFSLLYVVLFLKGINPS